MFFIYETILEFPLSLLLSSDCNLRSCEVSNSITVLFLSSNFKYSSRNFSFTKSVKHGASVSIKSLNKKSELIFVTNKYSDLIHQSENFLKKLGYSENIKVQANKDGIAPNAMSIITDGLEVYIPFEELVDIEEERKRLEDEKKKVLSEIERATKMLSNPGFINKAPESKINEEKEKLIKYQDMLKSIEERLK